MLHRRLTLAAAAAILLGAAGYASADPPGRVGRLSFIEGTVSLHTADQEQWSPAALNYPVTTGTSFWTEPGARAELQAGSVEVRLDQSTEVDVLRLDDGGTQIQVPQGEVNIHVNRLPPGGVSAVTPQGQVALVAPGSYHINAGHPNGDQPSDSMQVGVLEGRARVSGPRSTLDVMPGEAAMISGNPVNITLVETNATPFDNWALLRERREAQSESVRYVSPETTGYQDLDNNGRWQTVPDYGPVWYPSAVPVGWQPYRYGHWAFVPPWGWTWIDDAPWGFAPFHYGRWAFIHGVWGWCPGRVIARPVYAPALVAFIGHPGWSISVSVGTLAAVGWVPLAPREVYHPYYPASVNYVRQVNVTNVNTTVINNITNVTTVTNVNTFANRQAATVVAANSFTQAAPVQRAALAASAQQIESAQVSSRLDHLRPTPVARTAVAGPLAREQGGTAGPAAAPATGAPASGTPAIGPRGAVNAPARNAAVESGPAAPASPGPRVTRQDFRRNANVSPTAPAAPNATTAPNATPPAATVTPRGATQSPNPPAGNAPAINSGGTGQPGQGGAPGPRIERRNVARPGGETTTPNTSGPAPLPAPGATTPPRAATVRPPNQPSAPAVSTPQAPAPQAPAPQAPAPQAKAPRAVQPRVQAATPAASAPPQAAAVTRPVQQTHLQPTTRGWERAPAQQKPAASAPAAQPKAQPQQPKNQDDKRNRNQ